MEHRVSAPEGTDEQLMSLLCEGEDKALNVLVERYQQDIFRFCVHYLRDVERARDLTQETFVRVFTARGRFDAARSFRPWVLCIARNLCLNELKRKRTVHMESLEEYASAAREDSGELARCADENPDQQLIAQERHVALEQALESLPADAREIVVLRFFERMAAKEIAEIVGSTEGAVRTRLHRILKTLREKCQIIWDEH
jgi:RNA polymerase sigma-70 factor, ECF subfamily